MKARITEREQCPNCDEFAVLSEAVTHKFPYGTGADLVELSADIVVRRCSTCGFEHLAEDSQSAMHDAVCKHLGVLTPVEIRSIRERRGMTQKALAALTGIGVASLARWESGAQIQSQSHDRLLRLVDSASGFAVLSKIELSTRTSQPRVRKFRALSEPELPQLRRAQERFQLRPSGAQCM